MMRALSSRCLAAIIEQNCDENGIIWPMSVAPYKAVVVPVNVKDETQVALAEKITKELEDAGVEVIIDDRDERPGVKFKDWDLIGIPVRITVGKKAADGFVEYKLRSEKEYADMSAEDAVKTALELIKK